jgi:hypothetical protein
MIKKNETPLELGMKPRNETDLMIQLVEIENRDDFEYEDLDGDRYPESESWLKEEESL